MMIRRPAVAGQFYPKDRQELEETIASLIKKSPALDAARNRVKGLILPHAGYMYSGAVAAQTVFSSEIRNTLIILGPNHTGLGEPFSVMVTGKWQMPFGDVDIDSKLAATIVGNSKYLKSDTLAHDSEHSIEVLIPFLQFANKQIKIVPIVVSRADFGVYKTIAGDIISAITVLQMEHEVLIVASSDMTHYESQESAQKKDHYAIEAIVDLDAERLLKRVKEQDITMCGVAPVAVMLEVVKSLGARQASLVKYQTSGNVTGDYRSVVGYAGIRIS